MGLDLPGNGPDKATQLARHGRHGHLGLLLAHARQVLVAVMQTQLGFPGNVRNGFGQTFLALFQMGTDPRRNTVLPGGFDQGAPGRAVAHFGDATLLAVGAGGVFAGNQPQVTHQLAGVLEAVEIAQFGHQRGRVQQRHPAQTHQRPHHRLPASARHRPLNFLVVPFQPLGGFGDHVEHLLKHNLLHREGHFDLGQVTQVRRVPRRLAPIPQVVPQQIHLQLCRARCCALPTWKRARIKSRIASSSGSGT